VTIGLIAGQNTRTFGNGMKNITQSFPQFIIIKIANVEYAKSDPNKRKNSSDDLSTCGKSADMTQKKMDKTFYANGSESGTQADKNSAKDHKLFGAQLVLNPIDKTVTFNDAREQKAHMEILNY
jgi:hypothetical protein